MPTPKSILKHAVATLGIAAFVCGIWIVGTEGLSSLWAKNALDHELITSADRAISLNQKNPEAYYVRATLYRTKGQTIEAVIDLERAVDLRASDYFLRVELGYTRYLTGDIKGATLDFQAAVRLAPYYAQPRWYLGNMLLQSGQLDEGFAELRRAVKSDPLYLTETIQRAAEVFEGEPRAMVKAINPESSETRLALERYFIQHDNIPAAMELFRAGKDMPAADLNALLTELLAAKRYSDAYEVWRAKNEGLGRALSNETTSISNGGFETEIYPDATGFDWHLALPLEKIRVSRDPKEFHGGGYSLLVEYDGNSKPGTNIVSQLILVEPNTDYRLSFAAQTRDIVTGGLPLITVADAADRHVLTQSSVLPEGTSTWRIYEVDCKTAPDTRAVTIGVQRRGCTSGPCPAFGLVWFDDFDWRRQ